MKINVENRKFVSERIQLDVNFPYYGWWSSKKDGIIKMYPEYYQHDKTLLRHIVVITIKMGFGINTQIYREHILVSDTNLISEDIQHYLRDYADVATEKEFNAFKFKAVEDLI
jgi:hypothetical protein